MDLSLHEGDLPIPISIPIPITSKYLGDHNHNHNHNHQHPPPPQPNNNNNGPPPPTSPMEDTTPTNHQNQNQNHNYNHNHAKKGVAVVKYRECLKNHAASIGRVATDGCGEFMPSGEEGSMEALKCSACNCHRNFHRKEMEGENAAAAIEIYNPHSQGRSKLVGQKGVLISGPVDPFGYTTSGHNVNVNGLIPMPHHMIMPLDAAMQTSESDEGVGKTPLFKKRFRTKFTPDQKEKMFAFAEKVGWRLQKQEDSVVQHFCQEIGVRRRVLKVWMHNNKHNLAKKNLLDQPHLQPQLQQPQPVVE